MPRTSRPITVTLGEHQEGVDRRVESGDYASASEVLRDAMRALDREDAAMTEYMKREVAKALANPHPGYTLEEVDEELRKHRAEREKRKHEAL